MSPRSVSFAHTYTLISIRIVFSADDVNDGCGCDFFSLDILSVCVCVLAHCTIHDTNFVCYFVFMFIMCAFSFRLFDFLRFTLSDVYECIYV